MINGISYEWKPSSLPAPLNDAHFDGGPLGGRIEPAATMDGEYFAVHRSGHSRRQCANLIEAAVVAQRWARADYERQKQFVTEYEAAARAHDWDLGI